MKNWNVTARVDLECKVAFTVAASSEEGAESAAIDYMEKLSFLPDFDLNGYQIVEIKQ